MAAADARRAATAAAAPKPATAAAHRADHGAAAANGLDRERQRASWSRPGGDPARALRRSSRPPEFLPHLTVFVLACVVGWQVVWNVTPALHTPLMSVTNAISGIIVIGGMLQLAASWRASRRRSAAVRAMLFATINVAGGFLVTQRMLEDVPEVA